MKTYVNKVCPAIMLLLSSLKFPFKLKKLQRNKIDTLLLHAQSLQDPNSDLQITNRLSIHSASIRLLLKTSPYYLIKPAPSSNVLVQFFLQ